jgi:hypothetical protein
MGFRTSMRKGDADAGIKKNAKAEERPGGPKTAGSVCAAVSRMPLGIAPTYSCLCCLDAAVPPTMASTLRPPFSLAPRSAYVSMRMRSGLRRQRARAQIDPQLT